MAEGTKRDGEMSEKDLIRRIQRHVDNAINAEDGDVTNVRQDMFARYLGEKYGNERDGYSQYRSREVLQAVEWALPSLMRVFLGGVKPVAFAPSGPDDVQQAKLETDTVAYWFYQGANDESGFITLYNWLKDILMFPNGYVAVKLDEHEDTETDEIEGITEDDLQQRIEQAEAQGEELDYEITREYSAQTEMGVVKAMDATFTTTRWQKRPLVMSVPPDCMLVDHNHASLDLDSSRFSCIRSQQSRSELIEEGYSEDLLEDLSPGDDSETWNDEAVTRHFYEDESPDTEMDEYNTPADEMFWVHECYMRVDFDGDGRNELRKVVMAGCKILENDETDFVPGVAASALPIPHKHIGMSYAEIVADIQELMTTLIRQLLDNIYKQNVQRTFVSDQALLQDNSSMDALLDGRSEVIVLRGRPAEAVMPEVTTPIVQEIGAVIEQFKEQPQLRTGVAPQLSLDPSVLEKATMGAFVGALEQASQRLELLARMFAETAFKRVFQKIHYVLRTHFDKPQMLEINGQWQQVDTSKWRKRSNIQVNVGLGFNNKQMMLGMLTQLLQIQREAMGAGLADEAKLYSTLEMLVEQMNVGQGATFFTDPKTPGWKKPQPQPDPAMILAQAQADALHAEIKRKDVESQATIANTTKKTDAEIAKWKEDAEAKAAEMTNTLLGVKSTDALNVAKIAEIHARITSLNTDDKHQSGPAADSSEDEFALARGDVGGNGNGKAKNGTKNASGAKASKPGSESSAGGNAPGQSSPAAGI